jgi:hypothetical protein
VTRRAVGFVRRLTLGRLLRGVRPARGLLTGEENARRRECGERAQQRKVLANHVESLTREQTESLETEAESPEPI